MRWIVSTSHPEKVEKLARELGIPHVVAHLLVLRGLDDPEAADRFLHPSLRQLHDPFLMADMQTAVRRLRRAIENQEKILIYGDYDVDGTMAVVVLLTALRAAGARVETHIPHRLREGYGMRLPVVEQAAANGCKIVISVDTGVREHEVIGRAQELGVDCIVTDHHLPDVELPPACGILNPHRPDCGYPDKNLSGVGVAFKLVQALLGRGMSDRVVQSYLKIVAIGTIADVVPLVGENRVIVHFGLAGLQQPVHAGLRALLEVAGLDGQPVTTGDVGFRLAPRLNAAGRMDNARDAVDLFTIRQADEAREIAQRLDQRNRERQEVEDQILAKALEITVGSAPAPEAGSGAHGDLVGGAALVGRPDGRHSLVVAGAGWHRGVIGIVAQRLVERFYLPTLVIAIEDGVGHGSGRSIAGFHLLEALDPARELFDRYGGHAQAAGFSLPADRIPELAVRFETHARGTLRAEDLEPVLRVDAEVGLPDVDYNLYLALRQLEPYGLGNPTPVFAARSTQLLGPARVLKDKHLKLRVAQGKKSAAAVGWGLAERARTLTTSQPVDLAFTVDASRYQDITSLQLVIKDIRLTSAD
jgi:single-stranded-DNA-specific exonuclease